MEAAGPHERDYSPYAQLTPAVAWHLERSGAVNR